MRNPDDVISSLEKRLNYFISYTEVNERGIVIEKRQLVATVGNIKIEIFPNEHPPPHFHIKINQIRASISIYDGCIIDGIMDSKTHRKVMYFFKRSRDEIINAWNELRPSNCSVGPVDPTKLLDIN